MAVMCRTALVASIAALAFADVPAVAQGVAPGGGIGGSTGIGSGLGGGVGTGPSWPNGTNQAPQPPVYSMPPGGYPSPAPSSTYTPSPSVAAPSTAGGSTYRQPNEPYATSGLRPPATVPLVLPDRRSGSLAFLKGCWRSDIFTDGPRKATLTWCLDENGAGRYLYSRTDQGSFYCHGPAQAVWIGQKLALSSANPTCDDRGITVPSAITCGAGTDGALCNVDAAASGTMRLFRVR